MNIHVGDTVFEELPILRKHTVYCLESFHTDQQATQTIEAAWWLSGGGFVSHRARLSTALRVML